MAEISTCSTFHHNYDNPSRNTTPFTIHCTLEKGAEAYYSGIRVVVITRKTEYDNEFAKADIKPVAGKLIWVTGRFELQYQEDKDSVIDDYTPSDVELPFYTLIFELVDVSSAAWVDADITFQKAAETSRTEPLKIPETHRVLYEYEKSTTMQSPSCILPLIMRYVGLQSCIDQDNSRSFIVHRFPFGNSTVLSTHGFRVLPPSEKRPLFIQPPPEILCNIFSILERDTRYFANWRKGLVSMGLVCRAWWKAALCIIYEDFDTHSHKRLDIRRLATVLKANPMWGRYIKRFSLSCFARGRTRAVIPDDNMVLTVLKTASNMRTLSMGTFNSALVEEFVEVFCKMTELQTFTHNETNFSEPQVDNSIIFTTFNVAQLMKCLAHWPKLQQVVAYHIGQSSDEEKHNSDEFAPVKCALDEIRFGCGVMSIALLRTITASSQETLHIVALKSIRGISNKELTSWLLDFGPNLTHLTLQSNVFTRSEGEELAVDETISQMSKLSNLEVDGPIATVLTLLRYEPSAHVDHNASSKRARRIKINDPMLIDPHAFVIVLRTTKWETVDVTGLRISEGNLELIKEAKKVVSERKISLLMG